MHFSEPEQLPPEDYQQIIEDLAVIVKNPVNKLKLVKLAIADYHKINWFFKLFPSLAKAGFKKNILEKAAQIHPESIQNAKALFRQKEILPPQPVLWRVYKIRHIIVAAVLLCLSYVGVDASLPSIKKMFETAGQSNTETIAGKPLPEMPVANTGVFAGAELNYYEDENEIFPEYLNDPVWLVEKKRDMEIYSNGLHIITTYTVDNEPRRYYRFQKNSSLLPAEGKTTDKIAGIMFHSSESDLFPFRPDMNISLKKKSRLLIKYIGRIKSYHYLIDRFGLVYRIVRDDHTAYHAGNSVWADDHTVYLSLNNAFIGICFESKDFETVKVSAANKAKKKISPNLEPVTSYSLSRAQLASGKELTDWLRYKYKIPQQNCLAHSLASMNPKTMIIGHHLDLSHGFPFNQLGLNNRYLEPIPVMTEFGFTHDAYFETIFGGKLWPGIALSQDILKRRAGNSHMDLSAYRKKLNKRFTKFYKWQKKQYERFEEEKKKS